MVKCELAVQVTLHACASLLPKTYTFWSLMFSRFHCSPRPPLVMDEAHATGLSGHCGRGLVVLLGVEVRVLARLHTFGKALAATG